MEIARRLKQACGAYTFWVCAGHCNEWLGLTGEEPHNETIITSICRKQGAVCSIVACTQLTLVSHCSCQNASVTLLQSLLTHRVIEDCYHDRRCCCEQVYLHQLSETNGSEILPPAVTRTLNAKACRSAIMFGDPLLPTECAQLLLALKATQLCFTCAHGRPTLIPFVHIQKLREQLLQKTASKLARPYLSSDAAGLKQRLTSLLRS